MQEKAGIFQEVIRDGVVPYPGVTELVTALQNIGVPLAIICSGALLSDILPILGMLGIGDSFQVIVTADDVKKSKPDRILPVGIPAPDGNHLDTRACLACHSHRRHACRYCLCYRGGLSVLAVTNSYPRERLLKASCIVDSLGELKIG